jgi:hypothetical protein
MRFPRFRNFTLALMMSWAMLPNLAHAKCDANDSRIGDQIRAINKKWELLDKANKSIKFVGKVAKRGKCAETLLRIGAPAPFALPPDEAFKDAHEAISCLALDKWQLEQECKCGDRGLKFSRDESAETATLQAYKEVQALSRQATKIGIPNKAIQKYVDNANEVKSCFDMETVTLLRNAEHEIQLIINSESGLKH